MEKTKSLTIAGLFLSVWLLGCDSERYAAEEKFAAVQKKLMASVNDLTRLPPNVELDNEPYIKGKIAVFETRENSGNNFKDKTYFMQIYYFREMEESYAAAPEEVGTVALLDCRMVKKGVYKTADGREYPAETIDCELTMIDRAKPAVIFKKKFEKTPSEESKAYGNSMQQQGSGEDILQFLKGLPRK